MSQFAVAESRSPRPPATKLPEGNSSQQNAPRCKPIFPPDRLYHGILLAICSSVLLIAPLLSVRDRSQVMLPLLQVPLPELCTMRRFAGISASAFTIAARAFGFEL